MEMENNPSAFSCPVDAHEAMSLLIHKYIVPYMHIYIFLHNKWNSPTVFVMIL